MKTFVIIFYGMLLTLMVVGRPSATVLIPKDFKDLTKEADIVFVGTVTNIHSEWSDQEKTGIYTYITFSNLEIIIGDFQDTTLIIRISGGQVDDRKILYLGIPQFEVGKRDLIFLSGNFVELCPIVGWVQGRFRVVFDETVMADLVLTNDRKPIEEIRNNKIILSRGTEDIKSSPGIPGNPKVQVRDMQGSSQKMTASSFINAIKKLRTSLEISGEVVGYQPQHTTNVTIPLDALTTQDPEIAGEEKVIDYDEVPKKVKSPSQETD